MFIQIQETPNKNSLKFCVEFEWLNFVWECRDESDAKKCVLANSLFGIEGVVYLMFGRNFVSVTKTICADWEELTPVILEVISDYISENKTLFPTKIKKEEKFTENSLEEKISKVLEEKIRPSVGAHGGEISFVKFENGVVFVELKGACKGCPSSEMTLKHGIQNLLKYFFPEVKEVRAI